MKTLLAAQGNPKYIPTVLRCVISARTDQRRPAQVLRGYEPAMGANWLDGHGFLGESYEEADNDATENVEWACTHSTLKDRCVFNKQPLPDLPVRDGLGPVSPRDAPRRVPRGTVPAGFRLPTLAIAPISESQLKHSKKNTMERNQARREPVITPY